MAKLCLVAWKISPSRLYLFSTVVDMLFGMLLVIEGIQRFLQFKSIDSLVIIFPTLFFLFLTSVHISKFNSERTIVSQVHKYFMLVKIAYLMLLMTFVVSDEPSRSGMMLRCGKLGFVMMQLVWTLQIFVHINNQLIKLEIQSKSSTVALKGAGVELPR